MRVQPQREGAPGLAFRNWESTVRGAVIDGVRGFVGYLDDCGWPRSQKRDRGRPPSRFRRPAHRDKTAMNGAQLFNIQGHPSGPMTGPPAPGLRNETGDGRPAASEAINNYYGKYQGAVTGAANAHGIDANLLAAVGVRESGFRNSVQSGGAGGGIFQIDLGQHPNVSFSQAMDPSFSANYAAGILQSGYASGASLGYGHDMSNAGALRQYNAGPRYFKQKMAGGVAALDKGTTGANHGPGNYVSNVLAISTQCF